MAMGSMTLYLDLRGNGIYHDPERIGQLEKLWLEDKDERKGDGSR